MLKRTRVRDLAVHALLWTGVGFGLGQIGGSQLLPQTWWPVIALWSMAVLVFGWSFVLPRRMPQLNITSAALALSAARVGAWFGGLVLGLAISAIELRAAVAIQAGLWKCLVLILGSLSLVFSGLRLERKCALPPDA